MSTFKNYEDIMDRLNTARQIRESIGKYHAEIMRPQCDKYGMGFNDDTRFSSAKVTVSVDAYTGQYGSSSCGGVSIVRNEKIFSKAFILVLNRHFEELMLETARHIENEALADKAKAVEELKDVLSKLESETLQK